MGLCIVGGHQVLQGQHVTGPDLMQEEGDQAVVMEWEAASSECLTCNAAQEQLQLNAPLIAALETVHAAALLLVSYLMKCLGNLAVCRQRG